MGKLKRGGSLAVCGELCFRCEVLAVRTCSRSVDGLELHEMKNARTNLQGRLSAKVGFHIVLQHKNADRAESRPRLDQEREVWCC